MKKSLLVAALLLCIIAAVIFYYWKPLYEQFLYEPEPPVTDDVGTILSTPDNGFRNIPSTQEGGVELDF